MKINTLNSVLKNASKNLKSNATINISSIISITLTLFLLGLFALFVLNLKMGISSVYSQGEIKITLKNNIKIVEQERIHKKIKETRGIDSIDFKENNQLQSYIIKVNEPGNVHKITSKLNRLKGIYKIDIGKTLPRKISMIVKAIKFAGLVIFMVLIVAVFFVIKYTMRLSIQPRIREISIMQYVGATDKFVKYSFALEGVLIGLIGSLFSVIAIYLLYSFVYAEVSPYIKFINPVFVITTMSWVFIFIGIILTAIANRLIIKRFLVA